MIKKYFFNTILSLILPTIIFIIWYFLGLFELINTTLFPILEDFILSFINLMENQKFWVDTQNTITRMFIGYILASIVGILVGLLMGIFKKIWL